MLLFRLRRYIKYKKIKQDNRYYLSKINSLKCFGFVTNKIGTNCLIELPYKKRYDQNIDILTPKNKFFVLSMFMELFEKNKNQVLLMRRSFANKFLDHLSKFYYIANKKMYYQVYHTIRPKNVIYMVWDENKHYLDIINGK